MELASRIPSEMDRAGGQRPRGHKWTPQLAGEQIFLDMLRRERRRTERSGRSFLLVLISGTPSRSAGAEFPVRKIASALSSCTREIDFLGWFEEPDTVGLLVTEFGNASTEMIEQIVDRISTALQKSLSPEVYCRLSLVV